MSSESHVSATLLFPYPSDHLSYCEKQPVAIALNDCYATEGWHLFCCLHSHILFKQQRRMVYYFIQSDLDCVLFVEDAQKQAVTT